MNEDIIPMIEEIAQNAKDASRALSSATTIQKNDAIQAIARELESNRKTLIEENEKDLKAAPRFLRYYHQVLGIRLGIQC